MFNTNFYNDALNYLSSNFMYLQNELNHFAHKLNLVSKLAYSETKIKAYESCAQQADKLNCLQQTQDKFQQMEEFFDKANEMLEQANKVLEPAAPYILAGLGMYATYRAVSTVAYYCSAAKQQDVEVQSPTTIEKREDQVLIGNPETQVEKQAVLNGSESVLDEVDSNSDEDIVAPQNATVIERRHSI